MSNEPETEVAEATPLTLEERVKKLEGIIVELVNVAVSLQMQINKLGENDSVLNGRTMDLNARLGKIEGKGRVVIPR